MEALAIGSSVKIVDMCFDCLEHCFKKLNIIELLNVADSNEKLRHIARHVFDIMHRQKVVQFLHIFKNGKDHGRDRIDLLSNTFYIYELKSSLQFLRCFGDLVSKIEIYYCSNRHYTMDNIQYNKTNKLEHLILEYVNNFCAESLRTIKFKGQFHDYVSRDFRKFMGPFVNVENIEADIFFRIQLKVHELFPKVRKLEMICCDTFTDEAIFLYNGFMTNRFPYLEHLKISIDNAYKYNKENFAVALRLNPQIKSLKGNIWCDVVFNARSFYSWNVDEHFLNLEELDLAASLHENSKLTQFLRSPTSKYLHLKNLKVLNITFSVFDIDEDLDTQWGFPFTCDKLTSLTISAYQCHLKQFSNLLNKHPTVKKFKFVSNRHFAIDINDCLIISSAFPLLEEIFFEMVPEVDLVRSIELFPSLKHFHCYTRGASNVFDMNRLVHSMNDWSLSRKLFIYSRQIIVGKRIR